MSKASQRSGPGQRSNQARHRRGTRALALLGTLVAVGLFASGCVQVHAALAITSNDRVSGDLVIASVPTAATDHGPQLTIAPGLTGLVTSKSYTGNGYTGSDLTFTNLTFDQLGELATTVSSNGAAYHISLLRNGDLVTLQGSVDLSQLNQPKVDVQLKVSFPGPIVRTDGSVSNQTVSWTMKPGAVTSFSAADQYTIGNTRGWRFWALALGGGGGVIALFITLLALWARRRNLRKERAYTAAAAA